MHFNVLPLNIMTDISWRQSYRFRKNGLGNISTTGRCFLSPSSLPEAAIIVCTRGKYVLPLKRTFSYIISSRIAQMYFNTAPSVLGRKGKKEVEAACHLLVVTSSEF